MKTTIKLLVVDWPGTGDRRLVICASRRALREGGRRSEVIGGLVAWSDPAQIRVI